MADVLQLQQALKQGAIRSVNFFNGRLLASADLTREQQARRESDSRLGLALGDGVAFGLDVARDADFDEPGAPVVRVQAGLAINRRGQALRLAADTSVALTRRFESAAGGCVFADCDPVAGGTYIAGGGLYLLTIARAEASEGKAASNGLDPLNVRCNTDTTLEAVQFRLIRVNPTLHAGIDPGSTSFRNAIAYRAFGKGVHGAAFTDLLSDVARGDDLLDDLRRGDLGDGDVPLALVFLAGASSVTFIDNWAVKRTLARAEPGMFGGLVEAHRIAAGQAMFRQFQAHIAELLPPSGALSGVSAQSHFHYLPPVGVIPVDQASVGDDVAEARFFAGMTHRAPVHLNGARLEALVRLSLCFPPIDTQGKEMVWLYRVRENRMARDFASQAPLPRAYLVFASGHLPYAADAQFDLAYWNYGNFALAR